MGTSLLILIGALAALAAHFAGRDTRSAWSAASEDERQRFLDLLR